MVGAKVKMVNGTCLFIQNGYERHAEKPFRKGLNEIAKVLDGEFRLTPNQNQSRTSLRDQAPNPSPPR